MGDDDEEKETDWDCLVNNLGIGDTNDVDEVGVVETVMDIRLHKNGARQDIEDIILWDLSGWCCYMKIRMQC